MNYLMLYIFVTVYLCSKRTFGAPSKKGNKYDIDDFISSLLSSRKFDELADKIADKAVLKIANVPALKSELAIANNNKNSDDDSTEYTTQRPDKRLPKNLGYNERAKMPISNDEDDEKQTTEEPPKPRLNKIQLRIEQGDVGNKPKRPVAKEESQEIQEEEIVIEEVNTPQQYGEQDDAGYEEQTNSVNRPAPNDNSKVKPGKINTEALLKNDDDPDQPKLLLKYERFKKRVQQNKAHAIPQTGETNNYFKNYKISIHDNEKSNENKDQIAKQGSFKLDSTEKKTKQTNQQDKRMRLKGRKDLTDARDGEPDTVPYNIRKPLFRDGNKLKPAYQSPPRFIIRTTRQYYEYEDNEKSNLRSGPVIKQNFTDWKSEETEVEVETTPGYEQDEETTRKRMIRKEGNKYYTYLSGPEYEEFQAEMQKQGYTNEADKVDFS